MTRAALARAVRLVRLVDDAVRNAHAVHEVHAEETGTFDALAAAEDALAALQHQGHDARAVALALLTDRMVPLLLARLTRGP